MNLCRPTQQRRNQIKVTLNIRPDFSAKLDGYAFDFHCVTGLKYPVASRDVFPTAQQWLWFLGESKTMR